MEPVSFDNMQIISVHSFCRESFVDQLVETEFALIETRSGQEGTWPCMGQVCDTRTSFKVHCVNLAAIDIRATLMTNYQ